MPPYRKRTYGAYCLALRVLPVRVSDCSVWIKGRIQVDLRNSESYRIQLKRILPVLQPEEIHTDHRERLRNLNEITVRHTAVII